MMHEFSTDIITRPVSFTWESSALGTLIIQNMYLREEKCLNFVLLLLVLVSKKGKGELGKKIFYDFPRHSSVTAETVLSIPLLLSTRVDSELISSANEQSQIQVG